MKRDKKKATPLTRLEEIDLILSGYQGEKPVPKRQSRKESRSKYCCSCNKIAIRNEMYCNSCTPATERAHEERVRNRKPRAKKEKHREAQPSEKKWKKKRRKKKKKKRKVVHSQRKTHTGQLSERAAFWKPYTDRNKICESLGFETYADYLKSSLWNSIRLKVFTESGKKCQFCKNTASQVHHSKYTRENLSGENLLHLHPICRGCHDRGEMAEDGTKRSLAECNAVLGIPTL